MGKKKEIEIKTYDGDSANSKIYVLSQNIKNFSTYERAKAIDNFIERETKVLETHISNEIREFLHKQGIIIQGGSKSALERAFLELELKGMKINIYDRYADLEDERIIGQNPNNEITVIIEDDILSCAMEVEIENG